MYYTFTVHVDKLNFFMFYQPCGFNYVINNEMRDYFDQIDVFVAAVVDSTSFADGCVPFTSDHDGLVTAFSVVNVQWENITFVFGLAGLFLFCSLVLFSLLCGIFYFFKQKDKERAKTKNIVPNKQGMCLCVRLLFCV